MKKVLLTSIRVFLVLMLVGVFSGSMAYGQEDEEIGDPGANKIKAASDSSKMKPPINAGKNSKAVSSSCVRSGFGQALAPAKASDTVSPASTVGEISPAKASDTVSPASTAGSLIPKHPKAK